MANDKAKKIDFHVKLNEENHKKLLTLRYYSAKSLAYIINVAIEKLEPEDLK